jgi:hypothetical protein
LGGKEKNISALNQEMARRLVDIGNFLLEFAMTTMPKTKAEI